MIGRRVRRLVFIFLALAAGLLLWSAFAFQRASPAEFQAVQAALERSRQVDLEAAYTLDGSQLASVYANDARGWLARTPLQWLYNRLVAAFDREAGRGYLAEKQALIARQRQEYEAYLAELRQKESAGVLTGPEAQILQGETFGWPAVVAAASEVQHCQPAPPAGYPAPGSAPACGLTPTPTPVPPQNAVPHRGPDPGTLPPEAFSVEVLSVRVRGDEARAVVRKTGGTTELRLVRIAGAWYIASARLLEFAP